MFGPSGGNRGRNYGGSYGNSYPRRWRTHPGGMRRTRTNHLRSIDALGLALGNSKKPYRPSAGPGCGLTLGILWALTLGADLITKAREH